MDDSLSHRLQALSSAEDFLRFFGVPFQDRVVQLHRGRILQRFHQYLCSADGLADGDEVATFRRYREQLMQAYRDFAFAAFTPSAGPLQAQMAAESPRLGQPS